MADVGLKTWGALASLIISPAIAVLPPTGKTQGGSIGFIKKGNDVIGQVSNNLTLIVVLGI
jgi:hypothetical protein